MTERTIRPRPGDLEAAARPHAPVRSGEFIGTVELCDLCGLSFTNLTIHVGLPEPGNPARKSEEATREELVKAVRMAVAAWNTLGPRKADDDVSTFIVDWLIENRVILAGDDE